MKQNIKRCALFLASSSIWSALPATAANSFYAPGDLVLFFQKAGDADTVYANLGNAATLYRGSAAGTAGQGPALTKTNILDLNATLTGAFGPGWASDTSLYSGLAGVRSNNSTNEFSNPDGDPFRTLYISAARASAGTIGFAESTAWDLTLAGDAAMTSAATGIQTQNNVFDDLSGANGYNSRVTVSLVGVSQIDDQNPLTTAGNPPTTFQGNAMGNTLAGGIQQQGATGTLGNMEGVQNIEFALDLYRVLALNTVPGQVAGQQRVGSFEGTVTVSSDGMVAFLVPEPSSTALVGLAAGVAAFRRRRSA